MLFKFLISFYCIMSAWNDFVKKIYWEGKKKNANYEFKQALQDASKRKSEMGSTAKGTKSKKSSRKSKKGGKRGGKKGGTRRRRH
jgi:hypothetical protein